MNAASIPIEKSAARFLLSGSSQDTVWPSADMTIELRERMKLAGKRDSIEVQLFPDTGHYICGDGSDPARPPSGDVSGGGGSALATEQAAGVVWDKTIQFLRTSLAQAPVK